MVIKLIIKFIIYKLLVVIILSYWIWDIVDIYLLYIFVNQEMQLMVHLSITSCKKKIHTCIMFLKNLIRDYFVHRESATNMYEKNHISVFSHSTHKTLKRSNCLNNNSLSRYVFVWMIFFTFFTTKILWRTRHLYLSLFFISQRTMYLLVNSIDLAHIIL